MKPGKKNEPKRGSKSAKLESISPTPKRKPAKSKTSASPAPAPTGVSAKKTAKAPSNLESAPPAAIRRKKQAAAPSKTVPSPNTPIASKAKRAPAPAAASEPARPQAPLLPPALRTRPAPAVTKKPALSKPPAAAARPSRKAPASVPPILLERDTPLPSSAVASGPGQRYALGPAAPPAHFGAPEELARLPGSYGTGRLELTARDPHWLFASWDLTMEYQQRLNQVSADGHLILRIFRDQLSPEPASEIHVHPESQHWFAHVDQSGAAYVAELGYRDQQGQWKSLSISSRTVTPPESLSENTNVQFASLPPEVTFEQVIHAVESVVREHPLLSSLVTEQIQAPPKSVGPPESFPAPVQLEASPTPREPAPTTLAAPVPSAPPLKPATRAQAPTAVRKPTPLPPVESHQAPAPTAQSSPVPPIRRLRPPINPPQWSAAQERALARVIRLDEYRRVWIGSLEITELVRRHLQEEISSISAAQLAPQSDLLKAGPLRQNISSPAQFSSAQSGFWFSLNAEIVIYGATEPDAQVRIAGRSIRLRPDGTFSYRFSLPDGEFTLRIEAVNASKTDGRSATLRFSRQSSYMGQVETLVQDTGVASNG